MAQKCPRGTRGLVLSKVYTFQVDGSSNYLIRLAKLCSAVVSIYSELFITSSPITY